MTVPTKARQNGGSADLAAICKTLTAAVRGNRLDEAEALFQQMCEMDPRSGQMLIFPVLITILRGRPLDALRFVNEQPVDRPELRALCLRVLGDPGWHGEAAALVDSPDRGVAHAMRQLLADAPLP